MITRAVLKGLVKKICMAKMFLSSVKDGTTSDNGEKFDCHISNEDYLPWKKNWN